MKKYISLLILLITSSLSISATASTDQAFTPFTTLAQAQQYCPTVTTLVFTQKLPGLPNGAGTISSFFNKVSFNSTASALHPQNVDPNGVIQNIQFRDVSGIYGYLSGNVINCFYSYPGFTGVTVGLIMQGKTS